MAFAGPLPQGQGNTAAVAHRMQVRKKHTVMCGLMFLGHDISFMGEVQLNLKK